MSFKEKFPWIKHLDFIVLDLVSLIIAFCVVYGIRFNRIDFWNCENDSSLFVFIIFVNLIVMFLLNAYSGILRKRYYQQFSTEVKLLVYQFISICMLFYILKIGTNFSRILILGTYSLYFVIAQITKYINKKIVTGEWKKEKKYASYIEDTSTVNMVPFVTKSKLHIKVSKILKRTLDIGIGLIGCIILVPLTVFVFFANKLNKEDGPIFFMQERIGKNGRIFKMIKFRSMCIDADDKLEEFLNENPEVKEEFYIYKKIKDDPRITTVGKFLRKTSLDEFPQFINVLKGEMSIVGPRPYLIRERSDMGSYYNIIIQDDPGVTGMWQVSGRSNATFQERLDLDIKYHKQKSVRYDIKLFFKTVVNVLGKKGAI